MKSTEIGVLKKSEVYFSSPSQTAKKLYYYPISAGHFFCVKNYHLRRENYDSLLITHIIDGTFTYVKDEKHFTAKAGDTVILDCYNPHEYYTNDSFESIWIHISGSNCFDLFQEIEKNDGNIIKCRDIEHVKKLLFRIFNDIKSDNPPSELEMSLDIYKLFTELLNPQSIKSKGKNNYEDNMQEVKDFITDNLNENLSVQKLADCVHMSASHFARVFKQQTGFSPYDFVLIARLNRAKDYLQKTDMSISQIAYNTGFNSESNFIYFFTKNTGLSPNKFRKLKF
ncbi:MAG: AraC family transcriptional regulator [Eubacterium sp.]|nr:AraC family transcriptional regulator [Eubacterium sp.]